MCIISACLVIRLFRVCCYNRGDMPKFTSLNLRFTFLQSFLK
uniref:Uncharacterized protein n=1 Tax=Anguilla anguilla TaxID=7936 RepID=A0A0E9S363_ANGAN